MKDNLEIKSYNKEGVGRIYTTPNGDYPSVTTVLGAYGDKTWLEEWRARIGEEEADRITKESTDIGTHLHYLFECVLSGEKPKESETPEEKKAEELFKCSKAKLLRMVDDVICMERPVWSDKFRVAGRFDLLCKTSEGKIALVDFKNSRRPKKKSEISSYRLQLAFYSQMIKETLGIDVEQQKIFMVTREKFVQIFDFQKEDTPRSELVEIRKKFWEKYGF
jgi:genome maintenance exonuclease 1